MPSADGRPPIFVCGGGGQGRISRDLRVNQQIRARDVRLVDEEGQQLGIVPLREALQMATERGLDVVEVAPNATPVVCRIMDYGRFKYEQEKREREARRRQHLVEVKELVVKKYTIDPHDLEIMARKAERILRDGDKLKVTLRFRGREIVHADLGREVFQRMVGMLAGVAHVESPPKLEGRSMIMTLAANPDVQRAAVEARRVAARSADRADGPEADERTAVGPADPGERPGAAASRTDRPAEAAVPPARADEPAPPVRQVAR